MLLHRLYVCTTCVRDGPVPPGGDTRGARLAAAVREQLKRDLPDGGEFDFLQVPCLSGCLNPCNVAMRAPRKYNLRFSRVDPEEAPQVVQLLRAYMADPLGNPSEDALPESLRMKRTVHTPPPHLLLAGNR